MERFYGAREVAERRPGVTLHPLAFEEPAGFGATFAAMRLRGVHPTACFCAHDGLALTVVSHLLSLGLRIPEDVSVVGFGDFAAAMQISPALTTVRVEGAEIGAVGLRLLVERIDAGEAGPARRVQIVSRLVERRSSGPCPVGRS
jgi:LacI family transcriptional regulator